MTVIGLPKEDEHIPASPKCSVAGWGKTISNNKQGSGVLMEVAVTLEDNSECKSVWQNYFDIKQMMCTSTTGGKGFCQVTKLNLDQMIIVILEPTCCRGQPVQTLVDQISSGYLSVTLLY